jgi:2-iminobutanoate/2-iminopropanoate deaminase
MITRHEGKNAPAPVGPYSPAIRVGNLLFVAGQGPFAADGKREGETFEEQLRVTMRNLSAIAEAAGTSLTNAVRMGAFLSSLDNFDEFNRILPEFLTEPYPARTTVPIALRGFDVEIDMVIAIPE